jgi:hypothetical protein
VILERLRSSACHRRSSPGTARTDPSSRRRRSRTYATWRPSAIARDPAGCASSRSTRYRRTRRRWSISGLRNIPAVPSVASHSFDRSLRTLRTVLHYSHPVSIHTLSVNRVVSAYRRARGANARHQQAPEPIHLPDGDAVDLRDLASLEGAPDLLQPPNMRILSGWEPSNGFLPKLLARSCSGPPA